MAEQEMMKMAAQAQYADMQGGVMAGSALQNAALSKQIQQPMRERVQGAHKRACGIVSMLANLSTEVMPPNTLDGLSQGNDACRESTLSGDIDDLARTISQIESQVARLSVAITGAA